MESTPQLPTGLALEDLRFVHPQVYPLSMGVKGWAAEVHSDVEGNSAKVRYVLSRPVPESFDIDSLATLAETIGIIEDGAIRESYSLYVDCFDEARPLAHQLREKVNPHEDNQSVLIFDFTGFPTAKTMDVLLSLEHAFDPPRKKLLSSFLGKLGLRG